MAPGTVYTNTLNIDDGYHPPFVRSAQVVVARRPEPVAYVLLAPCDGNADGDSHGDGFADRHHTTSTAARQRRCIGTLPLILHR